MKRNVLLIVFFSGLAAALFYGSSSGVGAVQLADRTGSPLATTGNCDICHGGGNFNTAVELEVLDGTTPVTSYLPGQKYTFKVKVNASNNPAAYGFQSVALRGATNLNAGAFGTPPGGTQVTNLSGRQYFEHKSRNTVNNWSIEWTAPDAGSGDVRFYASGNAVNADNDSGGDLPNTLSSPLTLTEGMPSATTVPDRLDLQIRAFPNPVREMLTLELQGPEKGPFHLQLLDRSGQLLQRQSIALFTGRTTRQIDMQSWPAGHYTLLITDGRKISTVPVIKQ